MSSNKERYCEWVAQQEYVPLMMQPWWMDAVCAGKEWDVIFAEDSEGNILGALPFLLRKRACYKYIVMPQMTQTGGIWVSAETTADKWATAEVCRQLVEKLGSMDLAYYYQQFRPNSLCVEAMRGLGFKIRERVTYQVCDLSDLDALIASFSKNKRRQLQRALSLHAERGMNPEDFYRFHTRCMAGRHRKLSYSREFLLVLERKTRRLGQCEIISICNADGQPYAAALLVWDKKSMYYLIPCFDTAHADSGASSLLVLEAMKLAREKHVIFDFEGSIDRGIANHYKQFGSTPVTYYSVEKCYKPLFRLALWFQHFREIRMH